VTAPIPYATAAELPAQLQVHQTNQTSIQTWPEEPCNRWHAHDCRTPQHRPEAMAVRRHKASKHLPFVQQC